MYGGVENYVSLEQRFRPLDVERQIIGKALKNEPKEECRILDISLQIYRANRRLLKCIKESHQLTGALRRNCFVENLTEREIKGRKRRARRRKTVISRQEVNMRE